MELPITIDRLRTMVATAKDERAKHFHECVLRNLVKPEDIVVELRKTISDNVFRQTNERTFRIKAGEFLYIYSRFGDPKQVQKEMWVVLEDYLKNFPSASRILETSRTDGLGTPVGCTLVLCFNLPWSPPTSDQTNTPLQPT